MSEKDTKILDKENLPDMLKIVNLAGLQFLGNEKIESKTSEKDGCERTDYYVSNSKGEHGWLGGEVTNADGTYVTCVRVEGVYLGHKRDITKRYDSKGGRLLSRTESAQGYDDTSVTTTATYTYNKDGSERMVRVQESGSYVTGQGYGGRARLGYYSTLTEYTTPERLLPDGTYSKLDRTSYKKTEKNDDGFKLITTCEKGKKVFAEERWPNGNLKSQVEFANGKPKNRRRYDEEGHLKRDMLTLLADYGVKLTGRVIHCGSTTAGKLKSLFRSKAAQEASKAEQPKQAENRNEKPKYEWNDDVKNSVTLTIKGKDMGR